MHWVSYDVEDIRFYVIPDSSEVYNLTELDKVKLRKHNVQSHIEGCMEADSSLTFTSIILNPQTAFEKWMPKAVKTISKNDSITIYKENDEVIYQLARGDSSSNYIKAVEPDIATYGLSYMPSFTSLPEDVIQAFINEGVQCNYTRRCDQHFQ